MESEKGIILRTKNFIMETMTSEERNDIVSQVSQEEAGVLEKAEYGSGENNPSVFDFAWKVTRKINKEVVGYFSFCMNEDTESVRMFYCYVKNAKEALNEIIKVVADWVFWQKGIYYLELEESAKEAREILLANKFREEGEILVREKPNIDWVLTIVLLGFSLGMIIGSIFSAMDIGIYIGIPVGIVGGVLLEIRERSKRKKIRERRKSRIA